MNPDISPEERGLTHQRILARLAKDTYVRVYFVIGGYPTVCAGTLEGLSRGYVSVRDIFGSISDIPLHTVTYVRVPEQEVLADATREESRSRQELMLWALGGSALLALLVPCMMYFPHHHTAVPYVILIVGVGGPVGYLIGDRQATRDAVQELSSLFATERRGSVLVHSAIWSAAIAALIGMLLVADHSRDVGVLSALARIAGMVAIAALAAYGATVAVRRWFAYRSR